MSDRKWLSVNCHRHPIWERCATVGFSTILIFDLSLLRRHKKNRRVTSLMRSFPGIRQPLHGARLGREGRESVRLCEQIVQAASNGIFDRRRGLAADFLRPQETLPE